MKRSEMVKLVLNDIKDILNNSPKVINDIENKNTIELILDLLESKGMLPPTDEEKSFKMLPSGEMIYQVNEWEPEYDTNEGYDGLED